MNQRERALAAMRGLPVDHIPFMGRMDLWYNCHRNQGTLPHPYEKASLWDIQRDLGIGIGYENERPPCYRLIHRDVEIGERTQGDVIVTRYHTPYGTLTRQDTRTAELREAAAGGLRTEYPFKMAEDYDALQFLIEHT